MNCRRSWNKQPAKNIERLTAQAKLAEASNHFAMAAILWRRVNATKDAETCETILAKLASNPQYKLRERNPTLIGI